MEEARRREEPKSSEVLIAIIRDKDHVLIGIDSPENLNEAQKYARVIKAHCYIPMEGDYDSLREKIGKRLEDNWQCRWKFDLDD